MSINRIAKYLSMSVQPTGPKTYVLVLGEGHQEIELARTADYAKVAAALSLLDSAREYLGTIPRAEIFELTDGGPNGSA